jgi:hypothetical protein
MMNMESPVWYRTAIPEEQELYREWLQGVLKMHTVDLTFRKKDDTIREMKCTLADCVFIYNYGVFVLQFRNNS